VLTGEAGTHRRPRPPAESTPSSPRSSARGVALDRSRRETQGKRILLANKEALVIGWCVFHAGPSKQGARRCLPIDSEHNAIFQCLPARYARNPAESGRAQDRA
jgi:1-deoxy-D-xylulose-5-phosphate reductoisomerase